jgi:hypothetical protein
MLDNFGRELNSNEKLAMMLNGMEGSGEHIVVNGKSAKEILDREKKMKFNDEVKAMEEKFEKHNKQLMEYANQLSEDLNGVEIMPMLNYALIKPFDNNPFQQIKMEGSIITDLGGMNIGHKSQETGEYEDDNTFIKVGTVIEVGTECKFLQAGDVVFYTVASECVVPFYKMGFVVVAEQRIIAVVNEKLTERKNNYKNGNN